MCHVTFVPKYNLYVHLYPNKPYIIIVIIITGTLMTAADLIFKFGPEIIYRKSKVMILRFGRNQMIVEIRMIIIKWKNSY